MDKHPKLKINEVKKSPIKEALNENFSQSKGQNFSLKLDEEDQEFTIIPKNTKYSI